MSAIRDAVLQIVGRPLFPVRWTDSETGSFDGPDRLVAMDPSGQVVTVEVCERLTSAGLVEGLSRSGRTASFGWVDLAEMYPRGASSFRSDWNEFRGGMPPRPLPGPRLYVVTGQIDDEVRPALEMLADSGIEVYEASQRLLGSGRLLVEIAEPYRVSIPTIGPTVARLAGRRPDLLEDSEEMSRLLEIAPDGNQIEAEIASVPGALSHPVTPRRGRRAAPGPVDAVRAAGSPEPAPVQVPADALALASAAGDPALTPANQPEGQAHPMPTAETLESQAPAHEWRSPLVDPALAALATALKGDQPLTWVQLRKGEKHEVTLRADGILVSADGREFSDPSEAARTLSGRHAADGWRVWRLADGRSIDEAMAELSDTVK